MALLSSRYFQTWPKKSEQKSKYLPNEKSLIFGGRKFSFISFPCLGVKGGRVVFKSKYWYYKLKPRLFFQRLTTYNQLEESSAFNLWSLQHTLALHVSSWSNVLLDHSNLMSFPSLICSSHLSEALSFYHVIMSSLHVIKTKLQFTCQ